MSLLLGIFVILMPDQSYNWKVVKPCQQRNLSNCNIFLKPLWTLETVLQIIFYSHLLGTLWPVCSKWIWLTIRGASLQLVSWNYVIDIASKSPSVTWLVEHIVKVFCPQTIGQYIYEVYNAAAALTMMMVMMMRLSIFQQAGRQVEKSIWGIENRWKLECSNDGAALSLASRNWRNTGSSCSALGLISATLSAR